MFAVSPIFLRYMKDDFIGECNDVRASITDQGSLSISVLVSDGTESKANAEN